MIKRECAAVLKKFSTFFPVVSVTGPRQSGKTTLVKDVFSEKEYVSLEHPEVRKHAENDPQDFLNQFPHGVIIDEVQRVPDLFSYIQIIVDENKEMGLYILTGSNQFEYMQNISQSLAGRISIIKLLPFSYLEIYNKRKIDRNEILVKGMYPAIFDRDIPATKFYPSYIETYLERDVRQIKNVTDLSVFHKFLELCAGRTGQILNRSSLSNECGVSQPTIEKWLTILEASYIIYRMPSYFKNIKKRIVKSPKLYFFDTGLVCNLLGIYTPQQLRNHPLRGEIFETFVVSELLKYRYHKGQRSNYYFYRDNHMNEVDVIIDTGYGPVPLEIKSGMTINDSFFKGLDFFRKLENRYKYSGLIYGGDRNFKYINHEIRDYSKVYEMCEELTKDDNWKV
ncbi:MAG: ATP-binding protein [Armatimonadetes bacterium]|nr:ATP-binding protein [Armatimonadota bacterium]